MITPTYPPSTEPTLCFIGVTTGQSSIQRIFPRWAEYLNLGPCALRGMDFPLHADPALYREAIAFIKSDPLTRGALVTTHKIDLLTACRDQFDHIDPLSSDLGEVSSIYKRDGLLHGRAVDPWTVGHSLAAFLPEDHWIESPAEVLILGAGGSAIALAWHLCQSSLGKNRPAHIHVANRSLPRLHHLRQLHATWPDSPPLTCHHVPEPHLADALLAKLPPRSLVVNATGLGKDAPGSPLTHSAIFPDRARVWDFNYRGDLLFLDQARAQEVAHHLHIEDGWTYFLHGWTTVLSDVFNNPIPQHGPVFEELSKLARHHRSA